MSEKITYLFKALVANGPSVVVKDTLTVDAYDKLNAIVPAGGAVTMDVQPGSGGQFLSISASAYTNLSCEITGGEKLDLDAPLLLIGSGAMKLLGTTQQQFKFTNSHADDIKVSILVGRDATP